ncbi:MAG: dienelactone hydrolase family protein [Thermoplasmata archaeon]|nr:dienelactone hydrolase family protein [Thermoplasmata archaeon]MCI4358893.1 dienelactone hydrolase family protein [Thermoplasmata archaeon]
MTDADLLLDLPDLEFGSGVVGVCDVCGKRQAVIVLSKERFKLCVIDFLNKRWNGTTVTPGAPLPAYRSERLWFPTSAAPTERAPAILLTPTKVVRHPGILFTPEVHGLTTAILDGAIRFAREGFEVMLPDLDRTHIVGPRDHFSLRWGARGGGVLADSPGVTRLTQLYADALSYLRSTPMADSQKTAVVGLSYGATLATVLATKEQTLSGLVLAYPAPVRPPELVRLVTAPTLFVAGRRDALALRARQQLEQGLAPGLLTLVDAGDVGRHFLARDLRAYRLENAEVAWKEMAGFLKARLFPPPPRPPQPPPAPRTSLPPVAVAGGFPLQGSTFQPQIPTGILPPAAP